MDVAGPDSGVPMLVFAWPAMGLAFFPVLLVEWFVARGRPDLAGRGLAKGVALANAASLLVGVPVAWAAWIGLGVAATFAPPAASEALQAVVLQVAWHVPEASGSGWRIPAGLAVLLLPIFLVSLPIEYAVCRAVWKPAPRRAVVLAVLVGNVWSHLLLAVLTTAHLARAVWDQAWAGV